MMKKTKTISILLTLTSLFLISCGDDKRDFSSYVPATQYCTSVLGDSDAASKVCNLCSINTADNKKVLPFSSSLIYASFPLKKLTLESVYDIENIMGKRMIDLHKSFDRHNNYISEEEIIINNLKIINESYGSGQPIKVDDDLFNILKLSLQLGILSEGRFNIAVGELSDYWNNLIEENSNNYTLIDPIAVNLYPDYSTKTEEMINEEQELLNSLKSRLDKIIEDTPNANELIDILILDEENKTVTFNKYKNAEKVSLSLGGIGKGYAINEVTNDLREKGYTYGSLNGASSSNVTLGKRHDNKKWSIGISSPAKFNLLVGGYLSLNGYHQISTSGDSVNSYAFYDYQGNAINRHHIIDTNTGYPMNTYKNFRKVTLVSKTLNGAIMDALSTVFINSLEQDIEKLLTAFRTTFNADLEGIFQIADEKEDKYTYKLTKGLKGAFSLNKNIDVESEILYYEF